MPGRPSKNQTKKSNPKNDLKKRFLLVICGVGICVALVYSISYARFFLVEYNPVTESIVKEVQEIKPPPPPPLDKVDYDRRLHALANYASTTASTTIRIWPAKAVYPNDGAILPFHRIVAYYGNFYSKGMGVLGQYPEAEMLQRLDAEIKKWQDADPTTPVMPAIDYIAVTAQGSSGVDGKYRLRMPDDQIDYALKLAEKVNGIVILDIQVGQSNVQAEIPLLEKYLKMPNVHVAIDPEFSMKTGRAPGTVIGTMDATDVNFVESYLAKLVRENNLTPKILIVHRFTAPMLTNYKQIKPLPEVQVVLDMDGWGSPARKMRSYTDYIQAEPIQFTGFKLFYKNDLLPPSPNIMTPADLLKLKPRPIFIQYQ